MSLLTLVSRKGGVGKTTVALNLAYSLARRGWSTLLVDGDPQGTIGLSIEGLPEKRAGLLPCLRGEIGLDEAVIQTRLPSLRILPLGSPGGEESRSEPTPEAFGAGLAAAVEGTQEAHDLVVVDTGPGALAPDAPLFRLDQHLLVPLQAEPLSLRSTYSLLEGIGELRARGAPLRLAGFLLTMLSSRDEVCLGVAQEAWSRLPSDLVLETFVPRDPTFLRASAAGVPVGLLHRRPPAVAAVFDQIAAEIEPRIDLVTGEKSHEPVPLLD